MNIVKLLQTWLIETEIEGYVAVIIYLGQRDFPLRVLPLVYKLILTLQAQVI